jgi:hypothetical protein
MPGATPAAPAGTRDETAAASPFMRPASMRTRGIGYAEEGLGGTDTGVGQQAIDQDLAFINHFGGHSTIGRPDNYGSYGAYRLNREFTRRLSAAGRAYMLETGQPPQFGEGDRDNAVQHVYYLRHLANPRYAAARAGHSLHNSGQAMDIPSGAFYEWLRHNGRRFGLGFPLGRYDPNHLQMQDYYRRPYPYHPVPTPEPSTNQSA